MGKATIELWWAGHHGDGGQYQMSMDVETYHFTERAIGFFSREMNCWMAIYGGGVKYLLLKRKSRKGRFFDIDDYVYEFVTSRWKGGTMDEVKRFVTPCPLKMLGEFLLDYQRDREEAENKREG